MTGWALAVYVMIEGVSTLTSVTPMPDKVTCEQYAGMVRRSASGQFGSRPRAVCHNLAKEGL